MNTLKRLFYSALCALALMFAVVGSTPKVAKADNEYPTCNTSDNIQGNDGVDQEGDEEQNDITLGGIVCTDPDPTGGIGDD